VRSERGALVVETAIVISLLILMATAVVEVGRYVAVWHGTHSAAREGARYSLAEDDSDDGVPRYADCSEIKWAAVTTSGLADLQPAEVEVTHDDGSGSDVHVCTDANIDPNPEAIGDGVRVTVTVRRELTPVTPLAGALIGPMTITAMESATIDTTR
jgi:Flp pilus assembly protein TadG